MNILFVFRRIMRQFKRDPRTLALVFLAPLVIMVLFYFLFVGGLEARIRIGLRFPDPDDDLARNIVLALSEQEGLDVIVLGTDDLSAELDGNRLDAAVSFPPDFRSAIGKTGKLVYEAVLEGSKTGMAERLDTLIEGGIMLGMRRMIRLPGPLLNLEVTGKLAYRYGTEEFRFIDHITPAYITFFLYFVSFILTCVSFLRERSSGTLERLLVSPIGTAELVTGYLLAFFILCALQGATLLLFSVYLLGIKTSVSIWYALVPMLPTVLVGVTMGIFFSTLARNEFQVIQFVPLVIIPQALLSGILFDIEAIPQPLRALSYAMPLTYTNDLLENILVRGKPLVELWLDFLALGGFLAFFIPLCFMAANTAHGAAKRTR